MTPEKSLALLLHEYRDRARKALDLFLHSARKLPSFDTGKLSSPDALEPYDALAGRFERSVEVVINPLLKAVEMLETGIVSETIRDRLNFACKLGLIEDVELWMEMRAARNRIAHDYLPDKIKAVHDLLLSRYKTELERFMPRFETYLAKRGGPP